LRGASDNAREADNRQRDRVCKHVPAALLRKENERVGMALPQAFDRIRAG
jgi:hypothetical protein